MESLPIDTILPDVVDTLGASHALVITAPPGAGKTTRVPRALFDAGLARHGEILVLQPRRLATQLAAARVAAELGEVLGTTVGYSLRFESVGGPQTRIRFVTEGILSRRIVSDPLLAGVSIVILDEFHERHLAGDIGLAFLKQLQGLRRPDLKLVVMSATIDAAAVAAYLEGAPVLCCQGSRFEVAIEHEERASDRPLHEKVSFAVTKLLRQELDGDILVFLPGAEEIRRAGEALRGLAARTNMPVVPLHGSLSAAEQSQAVKPTKGRKVILATNVAETSITIPGISAVVDSGLARVARHSAWSGLPMLSLAKISKASAQQRAGRAGRTRNGRVLRLYTQHDYRQRQENDLPEVKRADLAAALLTLQGAGVEDVDSFPWFEPPPPSALAAAKELLIRLGAFNRSGRLAARGRDMMRFPAHPRLARLIIEGGNLGVSHDAALIAALISEGDIRLGSRSGLVMGAQREKTRPLRSSDLLDLLDRFHEAEQLRFNTHRLLTAGLDPNAVGRVRKAHRQLTGLLGRRPPFPAGSEDVEEALGIAILAAFPDRVAARRATGSRDLLLCGGGSARLAASSVVHAAQLMVAVEAEERHGDPKDRTETGVLVRLASAVEPEWLAGLFPEEICDRAEIRWNPAAGRVDEVRRTLYGQIVLDENIHPAQPSEAVAALLAGEAFARGLSCFQDSEGVEALTIRLSLLSKYFPGRRISQLGPPEIRAAVEEICSRSRSLAELAGVSLTRRLLERLAPGERELLQREAPDRIGIGTKRSLKIHYEAGKPPWIESRLQDFFGLKATPAICSGRLPLTIHLLAPNRRAVQITQDIAGFWTRHYPGIRRELQRRYPKHAWPEPKDL